MNFEWKYLGSARWNTEQDTTRINKYKFDSEIDVTKLY